MEDFRTQSVMKVLGGFDDTPQSLFVGGCVRNALMNMPVTDIDIATIHRPDKVMNMLLGAGIRAIPTGLEYGTVTALIEDQTFEITTLRRDVETDGRHAVIAFTDKWEEDAARRDFTINTLLASVDGKIFDPTGDGLKDIQDRKVVFVGQPAERIAEDYLRILRFFRFYGRYGAGEPDQESLDACRIYADHVPKLSKERITQEFMKILALNNAGRVLKYMQDAGIMDGLFSSAYTAERMDRFCTLQARYEVPSTICRLSLLAGFNGKKLDDWFVLSNEEKDNFNDFGEAYDAIGPDAHNLKKLRALIYKFGNKVVTQSYLLRLAIEEKNPNLELLDTILYWRAPSFPITGDDLIAAGIPPGRNLGQKLKELEGKWIKSDFKTIPKI